MIAHSTSTMAGFRSEAFVAPGLSISLREIQTLPDNGYIMASGTQTDIDMKFNVPATYRSSGPIIVLLLILMQFSCGTLAGVFSTVQQSAKVDLALSDFQLSLVQGLATAIPLGFLSVPVGALCDRVNRVHLLIALSACSTIGTIATGLAPSVQILFAARMITGLGAITVASVLISLTADLYAPTVRGRALLVQQIGRYAGAAAAFTLGGALLGHLGKIHAFGLAPWRGVHLIFGLGSAVLTLALFIMREPKRSEFVARPNASTRTIARELWQRRSFLVPLFAGQSGVFMADSAAVIWAAPVLERRYGLGPEQFAGWMGILVLGSGVAGTILGGISADLGTQSGRRGGILLGALVAAAAVVPAGLYPIMPTVPAFAAALGLMLLGGTLIGVITATGISVMLPNEMRGLCVGLLSATAGVVAFGIAPTLVALVSGYLGGEHQLAPALAIVSTAISIMSAFAFLVAVRRAPALPDVAPRISG
jgi:MFS family permease